MNDYASSGNPDLAASGRAVEMTRFEEHLQVTTRQAPVSVARLQKFIVTEQKTFTVEVRREEVRLTTEPLTDLTLDQVPADQPDEIEIVLHEERISIVRELVPVERVKLTKKTITVHQPVTDTVRKEHIDVLHEPPTGPLTLEAL
ncbi:YsnF/AvaK domain-containing protein [Subtercola sp. YIM 133946]|uniref:YsnF/AvaK domain-containing protein n=1 Tax=Subtercola sp. YIM 133946 TaxID=3118909 RepID=UPI002F9300CB